MIAFLIFITAGVLLYMAVRHGREHCLHDQLFNRMPGSNYLALSLVFVVLAFFMK